MKNQTGMVAKVGGLARKVVRRVWMRQALKGAGGSDNYGQLERAYRLADPWNMNSPLEQARFDATAALVRQHFGHVGSMLEIGCGEAHQSLSFAPLCSQLYGIDVSETAVGRARARLPGGQFAACDIYKLPWSREQDAYDLVLACEVLYYMRDIPRAVHEMSRLGRNCLVTFFAPAARRVAPHLEAIPNLHKAWFCHQSTVWLACWWSNRRV